ncbi:Dabb family protein [Amnibacterium endophyticum]|uniref:Dabb family protein n=1 Tax=Amnibacterium endophyticum TaxID=2109337 RepID=A0ABW4LAD0_9MICO
MPVQHTVVFRLRHEPGSTAEAAFLDHAQRVLAAIDGVEDFRVARQVSPKSDLAWQFSMRFADDSAYAAYDASAPHRRFVDERWATEVEAFQEYDFEER